MVPALQLGLELGRELLLVERKQKKNQTKSSSHIYIDRMYGRHSHLGLAAEKIDAQIFRRSSLPPSPPRLHLCEGGDGDYTECSICAGETAEGLLQIHVMVNKSSICPNDKSCSKGRARGHQVRVTSCNCCCHPSRGATHVQQRWKDGGRRRLGAAKILSLQFSGDFPSTPLRTSRTAKLLAMF